VDGRRRSSRSGPLLPVAAGILVGLGVLTLVTVGVLVARQAGRGWQDGPGYAAAERFAPLPADPRPGPDASTGSWGSRCGRNTDGHYNADNVIVSPGRPGAAEHLHDYVGNASTDAGSTDGSLRAAGTSCADGDRSSYFWPVLRLDGGTGDTATVDTATVDRTGVVVPTEVRVSFSGNATSKVVAMPDFIRMTTGDARAVLNAAAGGGGAAPSRPHAWWSCSGTAGRFTTHYPLCPDGELTVRSYDFPSCWDGRNVDSPDHRSHIVFPAGNGACPASTFPVPRLRMTVAYALPAGRPFSIDAIPGQYRAAATDHGHFIDVMPAALRSRVVDCINTGRRC
jgi:hypothetical protein